MELVVGRIAKAHGITGELVVEVRTDEQMRGVIAAIGDDFGRLVDQLSAWSNAVRTMKGYPESGPHELAEAASRR